MGGGQLLKNWACTNVVANENLTSKVLLMARSFASLDSVLHVQGSHSCMIINLFLFNFLNLFVLIILSSERIDDSVSQTSKVS